VLTRWTEGVEVEDLQVDVVVIGGGPAGENAAWYARDNGLSVAVVERELVGGECSYWACMPSKALLRPGEVLAAARAVPGARTAVRGGVDVAATLRTRDAFTAGMDDSGQADWVRGIGATLVRGHGRLVGERTVEVAAADGSTGTLTALRGVVLATGTTAEIPPIDGLADVGAWDSRGATSATAIPDHLVVVGGGVVAVEMAQAYRWLGADVTVLVRGDRLLRREEPFVGEEVRASFAEQGIDVRTGVRLAEVRRDADGTVVTGGEGAEVRGDQLLIATGRRPATTDLGLDAVGLHPGRYVDVDEHLRVTGVEGDWLYAVGDVNGRALLTHHGKYQGRVVGDQLAGREATAWADRDAMVRVIFVDPQVAAVGLTVAEAADRGLAVDVLSHGMGATAGGALHGEGTGGTAQLIVDRERRTVLGATFTGPGVGEMLHAATIAVVSGTTLAQLWHAVPAFPTMSEVWLRLLEADRGLS
jgi:pyruvate/2-oxoglutarate dehydrogenase complex dihydrolipoamide dehydrogenase (E3) component